MKRALVAGSAGFVGISLTKALLHKGYDVTAIVRPGSNNNTYVEELSGIRILEIDIAGEFDLAALLDKEIDVAFYLVNFGGRYDFEAQYKNVEMILHYIDELKTIGCKRIVCTGSQAEYGVTSEVMSEELRCNPFCAYGSSKVASCYLSRNKAESLGIDWIWARIFSLYGDNEPKSRMLPALIDALKRGETFSLSSCRQNWDYLNVRDGAEALIALAERGVSGEIYNVAGGDYRPLKEYVEIMEKCIGVKDKVIFGDDPKPFVSLQPDISKIKRDTGWSPRISFEKGISELI